MTERTVIWRPQEGPQTALITCPIFEVFYGGARGGGKTEGSIGDWLEHSSTYSQHATGVFFRRKFKQLEEVVARSKTLFPQIGAKYNEQRAEWLMPGGARLKFRYIERDIDAQEYQGHSYTRVYVEEATNFPSPAPINLLRATLRSAAGVPCGMRLTGNPGGPGHHWVKKRFIDPDPRGMKILRETFSFPGIPDQTLERVFIPSKITDNRLLLENDPAYIARLRQSGSEALVKAWLEGLWDLVDGAFFDKWDENRHVLRASDWLPVIDKARHLTRFMGFDWGYAKPFSCGWYVVSDGSLRLEDGEQAIPDGTLIKYREWYGSNGNPNVGLRMDSPIVAKGILARSGSEIISYGAADPSIFIKDGGPSIAETMYGQGLSWRRADNKRIAGWAELRRRLEGDELGPGLLLLSNCDDTIRTLPTLQHDDGNAEDLDTEGEDHAADETRYACMSRPWISRLAVDPGLTFPKLPSQLTINELVALSRQRRLALEANGD